MARADDPSVMMRNPALLADLWDDQALLGAHLLLADSCFTPTGPLVFSGSGTEIVDVGDGPTVVSADPAQSEWADEAMPKVCYDGPEPFLPAVALSAKLADNLGVGLAFLPPEIASLSQWGNPDGTIDTPNGRRPNVLRYLGSHLNVTYFSLLGAVGYRPLPWLRVGFGFQWQLVAANAINFSNAQTRRALRNDIRVDVFTRDLFVPGVIGSVHLVPMDNLDVAFGFKWSDRIRGKAKLDLLSAPFGVDDLGNLTTTQSRSVPTLSEDQAGDVDAPPVWVPQLSASVRYGHRLRPRPRDWEATRAAVDGAVEDPMSSELFDVELTFIYYMNSFYDSSTFYSGASSGEVTFQEVNADGSMGATSTFDLGRCIQPIEPQGCARTETPTNFGGIDQISLRLGGDYNIIPGVLTVRAGASYESDGQKRGFLNPRYYMFERLGLHAGATLRVAGKTDISFGYAHFFQADIRTQFNEGQSMARTLPSKVFDDPEKYNYVEGEHDGLAQVEIPYGEAPVMGPNFANAGSLYYNLDVFSLAITQHF